MIVDFDDVFDDSDSGMQVPQEILTLINQDLPSNFCCYKDAEKGIVVGPKLEQLEQKIILNIEIDQSDEQLRNILKDIPKERWLEYFYRTQKRVPVKNVRIGNEDKQIPIEQTLQNPLIDLEEITECFLFPEPFPKHVPITIKGTQGDKVVLNMKRQPYESMDEIMLSNIDFPAFKITIILNEREARKSKIRYSATPTKAKNVSEAIVVLNVLKDLYSGTAIINGHLQATPAVIDDSYDKDQVEAALDLWTTLEKLEQILEITFDPAAEFPHEDAVFLTELKAVFLEGKKIKWKHPFEHFHIKGLNIESYSIEDIIGKEKVSMDFLEGPMKATLMGAEFELYSETEMEDFIITNIEWDDESKSSGELYIADEVNGKSWVLTRKYLTTKELEKKKLQEIIEKKRG